LHTLRGEAGVGPTPAGLEVIGDAEQQVDRPGLRAAERPGGLERVRGKPTAQPPAMGLVGGEGEARRRRAECDGLDRAHGTALPASAALAVRSQVPNWVPLAHRQKPTSSARFMPVNIAGTRRSFGNRNREGASATTEDSR